MMPLAARTVAVLNIAPGDERGSTHLADHGYPFPIGFGLEIPRTMICTPFLIGQFFSLGQVSPFVGLMQELAPNPNIDFL